MKKIITRSVCLFMSIFSFSAFAQNMEDVEYPQPIGDAAHPCITHQEYEQLEKHCAENIRLLGLTPSGQRNTMSTSLGWPLRPAAALKDCSYYTISAGVDHNPAVGAFKDYNCGTTTYDGHGGTDISTGPFNFYKMDNNLVEVVAAAAGTILYKSDGFFDKNCASNTDTANYIVIRHADGSQANYWHMKKNSVTTKAVGQTVAAGEYLGVVGSSGSSTGPHLHFEVWSGSTSATRIDPFAGPCNSLNATTWWATQNPYNPTTVVKVSTNTTDIVVPACPATETLNESNVFPIPFQGAGLPAGYAKFYVFIINDSLGVTVNESILNPDGSVFNSWVYNNTTGSHKISYWGQSKKLPTVEGTYTFKAVYNGTVCSTTFIVGTAPSSISDVSDLTAFAIYPNPSNGKLTVESAAAMSGRTMAVYNVLGEKIVETAIEEAVTEMNLNIQSGVYFYQVGKDKATLSSGKLIIQ